MSRRSPSWVTQLRAAAGDVDSLRRCLAAREPDRGLGAALALQSLHHGLTPHDAWRARLRSSTTNRLLLDEGRRAIEESLRDTSSTVVSLKGIAVAPDYRSLVEGDHAELARPTSDLDLLVAPSELPAVRGRLAASGWRDLFPGERSERYLLEEGYAWQARHRSGAVLELHHRLWNCTTEELPRRILETAESTTGHDLARAAAPLRFVVAAVHGIQETRPRRLLDLLDLEAIRRSASDDLGDRVLEVADRLGLQLPVRLAAGYAGRAFADPLYRRLTATLRARLRPIERVLEGTDLDALSGRRVTLARLLSARPTRLGHRAFLRALWAHPGVVERDTPTSLPWWRRRLRWQLRSLLPTESRP